ncbi:glycosyltransferase [Alteromonas lipolytica]|uniref:Glycosyltransferase subfamily 4-like N-terminal domain-containing protein n=1 Tax=Alteromonas lipolytica TaxID=1856405 RepID=A0A1E8FIQ6_9ALTE|nr:glycosyltransferase [Alteromonas lipolytica]OFI35488.1 hypothetical protein BFC17_12030 [Alteromonas lipolytica]GGF76674.1 hypothetical protein GCM10011338_31070 [Alteromonas lipolytica]
MSYAENQCDNSCETITLHIIEALINRGVKVDVLLVGSGEKCPFYSVDHPCLKVQYLRADNPWLAVPELKRYMHGHPGQLLLAVQHQVIQAASMANLLSGLQGNVVGLFNTTDYALGGHRLRDGFIRLLYGYTSGVITMSRDAEQQLRGITHLPKSKVKTLYDPIYHDLTVRRYIAVLTRWQCDGVCSANPARYLSA